MFLNLKVYSIGIILRDVKLYAIGIRKKYLKLIDLWNAFVLIKECIRKEIQSIKLVLRKEPRECLSGLLISKLMTIKKHNRIWFFLTEHSSFDWNTRAFANYEWISFARDKLFALRNYYVIGNKESFTCNPFR